MAKETSKPTTTQKPTPKPTETQKPLKDTTTYTERSSKESLVQKKQ
jgi:hypothetical protein